ncbi:helix-turn-helix domain-containing protein [Streptomyces sp. PA03-1a]|nr:helix-turn-helix domain-containing protein [Streptomyces sp. PA03-1a]MDX2817402.1 helix-turn-helix domain-containing protein [Streptomyces sp. PA03-5A]
MQKKDFSDGPCPVARTLGIVGDWWSLLIVRDALNGVRRFNDFHRSLGCAKNILSSRLTKLVEHGVLRTVPASDGSPYREYELTEEGKGLRLVLLALRQWGEANLFEPGEERTTLVDRATGRPVAPLGMRDADGRPLGPDDVELRTPAP